MDQQRLVHYFLTDEFGIKPLALVEAIESLSSEQDSLDLQAEVEEAAPVDDDQLTIFDEIERVEKEKLAEASVEPTSSDTSGNAVEEVVTETVVPASEVEVIEYTPEEMALPEMPVETVPEPAVEETVAVEIEPTTAAPEIFELTEDNSWPCLKCGEVQGPDAVFHEGQLCSKCAGA
jgi:hypothetical protein